MELVKPTRELYCGFCGKPDDQVERLIAGAMAFICNECVDLCVEVLKQPAKPHTRPYSEFRAEAEARGLAPPRKS